MALYQSKIAYDGTAFKGFQRQKNARTVQGEFENTLTKFGWAEASIFAAGRTDSGVHAEGQIVSFSLVWEHPMEDLRNALNHALPVDIQVQEIGLASTDFHPRFSAQERRYRYQVYFSEVENPLKSPFYWRVWPTANEQLLEQASQLFIGKRDFRAFGRPPDGHVSSVRTVRSVHWEFGQAGDGFLRISADAFLYHMVRRIVFVIIRAGQKRISLQDLQACFAEGLELPAGIAPARGLILEEIIY